MSRFTCAFRREINSRGWDTFLVIKITQLIHYSLMNSTIQSLENTFEVSKRIRISKIWVAACHRSSVSNLCSAKENWNAGLNLMFDNSTQIEMCASWFHESGAKNSSNQLVRTSQQTIGSQCLDQKQVVDWRGNRRGLRFRCFPQGWNFNLN